MILLVAGVIAVGTLALSSAPSPAPAAAPMGFWEAYARGFVSVVMENETVQEPGGAIPLPAGIRVTNTASVPVVISEEAVLMNPHPSQSPPPAAADTTADAVLTNGTIPAHGSVLYSFGEFVLAGWVPAAPTWWDLEEMQFSKAGVAFAVGGETLPFALRTLVEHPFYNSPQDNTQATLYAYLRSHPTVVVGKLPLWSSTHGTAGATVRVRIDATNLAVWATDDTETQNVNLTNGIVEDDVPVGWSVQAGSYSVAPDRIVNHANGSMTLEWNVSLPAPDVTGQDPNTPTSYSTATRWYTLVAPAIEGDVLLPRAHSDMSRTGTPDAQSAPVIVTGNLPPVADAGGPYAADEGQTILLNASRSSDPEGDPLQFRWSFTDNGTWDTPWSASPTTSVTYTDEFVGRVRVQVTDGHSLANATAPVTVRNVAPSIRSLTVSSSVEVGFRLVLAGEKGHDATLVLEANGTTLASLRVVREAGDPMAQSQSTGMLNLSALMPINVTVRYTPADDPVNGQPNGDNPAWLIITLANGTTTKLFHNFNVQHKSTWNWSLGDLRSRLSLGGVTLRANLYDPGADTLTARWDFGDGTNLTQVFPNGPANDTPESVVGGAAPMAVVATVVHLFPKGGPFTVTLTVTDADGASTSATVSVSPS